MSAPEEIRKATEDVAGIGEGQIEDLGPEVDRLAALLETGASETVEALRQEVLAAARFASNTRAFARHLVRATTLVAKLAAVAS